MIVGLAGVIANSGGPPPPYGTLLSQSCTQTTITDYNSNSYTGYYNLRQVYADGVGGTYFNDSVGGSPCHYPNGFAFSASSSQYDLYWSGCSNSGTLYNAGTDNSTTVADGAGGTYSTSSISWNYGNGHTIYDSGGMSWCRVILDTSMYPYYNTQTGGGADPYGTKYGTPYWDSGSSSLYMTIADGMGGTIQTAWDGNPPWPSYGTQVSTYSYSCNYHSDALSGSWYLCFYTNFLADGNGGSYTTLTLDGNYPYGYALSGYQAFTDEYYYSWYVYDNSYNLVYPWLWGYQQADGFGGSSRNYTSAPYGSVLSNQFYDQNNYYGEIRADGSGGYFFYNL